MIDILACPIDKNYPLKLIEINLENKIFEDDNVKVFAYPTSHGALEHTYAYRLKLSQITVFLFLVAMVIIQKV